MANIKNILKKEFKSYFVSPIAYIVISLFLLIVGWMFFSTYFLNKQVTMASFFSIMPLAMSFVIPAITMRLFSEEINTGSYEMLVTLPVRTSDIVGGKFLASLAFICVMLAPTLVYAVSVSFTGDLDWGPVLGGYAGTVLLGAAFCSIGLLASALTRNQVVAYIISMALSLFLVFDFFIIYFVPDFSVGFFHYLSANSHFQNFAKGIVDSRDLLYFLTLGFMALYAGSLVMEKRK